MLFKTLMLIRAQSERTFRLICCIVLAVLFVLRFYASTEATNNYTKRAVNVRTVR